MIKEIKCFILNFKIKILYKFTLKESTKYSKQFNYYYSLIDN